MESQWYEKNRSYGKKLLSLDDFFNFSFQRSKEKLSKKKNDDNNLQVEKVEKKMKKILIKSVALLQKRSSLVGNRDLALAVS